MRWFFLQRTVPNIKNFAPLEESIREKLIPAIVVKQVTDVERNILSLPVRLGGLVIQNPMLTAETEFRNSCIVTENLTQLIENQELNLDNYDFDQVKINMARLKAEKDQAFIEQLDLLKGSVDKKLKRSLELACEKGAGVSGFPMVGGPGGAGPPT